MQLEEQLEFEFRIQLSLYRGGILSRWGADLIRKLVPADFSKQAGTSFPAQRARFADMLALNSLVRSFKAPCALSVLLLCKYRLNAAISFTI